MTSWRWGQTQISVCESMCVCVCVKSANAFGGVGLYCGQEPQLYLIQSFRIYVFNLVAVVGQSVTW